MNLESQGDQARPTAAGLGGDFLVAWADQRTGAGDIYATVVRGGQPGTSFRVNDDGGSTFQTSPVAASVRERAFLVWEDMRRGDFDIYSSSTADGGVWSANVRVNDDAGTAWQRSPALAVDPTGRLLAVWTDFREGDPEIRFSASADGGATWGDGIPDTDVRVDDAPTGALLTAPAIAAGPSEVYVVWKDDRNGPWDIFLSVSRNGGLTWSPGLKVNDDTGFQDQGEPVILADSDHLYVAWTDLRRGNPDIYYTFSEDRGATIGDGLPNSDIRINDDRRGAAQIRPALVQGLGGELLAAWEDDRTGHYDIFLSRSTDGGRTWGDGLENENDEKANDDTGSTDQTDVAAAWTSQGLLVVWEDRRNGEADSYAEFWPGQGGGPDGGANDPDRTALILAGLLVIAALPVAVVLLRRRIRARRSSQPSEGPRRGRAGQPTRNRRRKRFR